MQLTRIHGAYHLEQLLLSEADYLIVDFEGDSDRPFDERRRLTSPLADVAGMIRSFHYAAGVGLMTRSATRAAGSRAARPRGRAGGRRG